ncbi:methyltransferase [Urechidicola croceus]|uniref:Methyltransferase n=1 Tax=Urechidicola croceus TaxID=1850246 RepID=A0A1D8PBW7_9FLAO|nr:methyltransferase [Urechidicola croceus]
MNNSNKSLNSIFISTKDYSVSKELFDLIHDEKLDLLITSPKPKNEDLGKYYESENYISHTDSKKSLFDRVYQFVKSYTISKKVKLINSLVEDSNKSKKLLDIGCGTGDFLVASKNNGWEVYGVEPSEKAKKIAEVKLSSNISSKISELTIEKYDVITMWHVLEHVPNLIEYISQLKQLLKPNGTLIVAVPNYKCYDANYYGKFWAAFDVPRHLWHFSKKSIQDLFEKENMKVVKTLPMKFDSYYVSLLSEKYKTGKTNPIKSFWIGFKSNRSAKKSGEYSSLIYMIKNS